MAEIIGAIEKEALDSYRAEDEDFSGQEDPLGSSRHEPDGTSTCSKEHNVDFEKAPELESGIARSTSTSHTEVEENSVETSIVSWDGPDDPANPLNWTNKMKWGNIAVISTITFITPLASSMFAPAIPEVLSDFHSNSSLLGAFSVSVYILGFAFGPLIIAPMSELYGRLPLYHLCNVLFIVFTVACGVSSNLNMLIGFRFLEGSVGAAPLTIGGGSLADMMVQEKRGGAMAIWAMGPLMGPVVGPVIGGFLSQAKGWRWIFWLLAMISGATLTIGLVLLRETNHAILLERKTKRLRKETGNSKLVSQLDSGIPPKELFLRSIIRPAKMLLFSPIVIMLSTYMAVVYGYLYLLFTTFEIVFEQQYGFSTGTVGLTYLGIGVGMFVGLFVFGMASDKIVKKKSAKGEMKPEYRLPPMLPGAFFIPIGLFWYGWSADKQAPWIVPIIGTSFIGIGVLAAFMPIQTYMVDAFTRNAASALAANTVLRSLFGAILPLAGEKMYAKLGLGWGNSLLAFLSLAMVPIPFFLYKYGERVRTNPKFQVRL
ncbi:MAG: hypothetical protein M1827_006884 [Pycnora praestabilis]|nr:MAG: hypothetical protein M1827_006884 [Pycnora praestabilis]